MRRSNLDTAKSDLWSLVGVSVLGSAYQFKLWSFLWRFCDWALGANLLRTENRTLIDHSMAMSRHELCHAKLYF